MFAIKKNHAKKIWTLAQKFAKLPVQFSVGNQLNSVPEAFINLGK
jgi:hypothetical protein